MENTESRQLSSIEAPPSGSQTRDYLQTSLIWVCLVAIGLLIGALTALEPALAIVGVLGLALLPWAISHIHIVILLLAVYTPFEEFVLKWLPSSVANGLRYGPEALILLLLAVLVLRNLSLIHI